MPTANRIRGETVNVVKDDNSHLCSILSIAMLELSIKVSLNPLIEVHMCCTKLLSKVCVEQRLETLIYFCKKAHVY